MIRFNNWIGYLYEVQPRDEYRKRWYAAWRINYKNVDCDNSGLAVTTIDYQFNFVGMFKGNNTYYGTDTNQLIKDNRDVMCNITLRTYVPLKARWFEC